MACVSKDFYLFWWCLKVPTRLPSSHSKLFHYSQVKWFIRDFLKGESQPKLLFLSIFVSIQSLLLASNLFLFLLDFTCPKTSNLACLQTFERGNISLLHNLQQLSSIFALYPTPSLIIVPLRTTNRR